MLNKKNQINEDKILELERERVLLAARSVMEGEETERSRLAGDLHNGPWWFVVRNKNKPVINERKLGNHA